MSDHPMNPGQQAAFDGFFTWLFRTDQPELCISGPGGYGKTWLMGKLINKAMPMYLDNCRLLGTEPLYQEVHMTATTNKAAEVLGQATGTYSQTIHSLLKLRVFHDYDSGRTVLARKKDWTPLSKKIVFIDEGSQVSTPLRSKHIRETLLNAYSKVVYVGDHCQLAPVGESTPPVYAAGLPFFELTQPMRNAEQPALMAVCQQLRETVESSAKGNPKFWPIKIVPGVIDHMEAHEVEQEVYQLFMDPGNSQDRILCYTNEKVNQLNDFIRTMRGMPPELTVGEYVVNNSAIINSKMVLMTEEEFEVMEIGGVVKHDIIHPVELEVRLCTLRGRHGIIKDVPVPTDRNHFGKLAKYYKKKENWPIYYKLVETYPDLRPRDAQTMHKAQGSTYNTALIDLSDLSSCPDAETVARLLYVALSRAKSRVILFGNLAKKYGGLTR